MTGVERSGEAPVAERGFHESVLARYDEIALMDTALADQLTDEEYLVLGLWFEFKGDELVRESERLHQDGISAQTGIELLASLARKVEAFFAPHKTTKVATPRATAEPPYLTNDWRHRAACKDVDPELFFPIGNSGPAVAQIEEAKAVCRGCDVQETCLQRSFDAREGFGIWGRVTEQERQKILKGGANRSRSA